MEERVSGLLRVFGFLLECFVIGCCFQSSLDSFKSALKIFRFEFSECPIHNKTNTKVSPTHLFTAAYG